MTLSIPKSVVQPLGRSDFNAKFLFNERLKFDAERGTVTDQKTGRSIKLPPVVSRLALFFCRNPNTLLLRKEVIKSVWEDYGFVVSQNSLNQSVSTLRDSLNSLDNEHVYIKTMPRIGYSFFAEVRELRHEDVPTNLSPSKH
ncbi:winged helix-turn-helix domain-containing protein [Caballeronia zhejiangensis]|uniref:winged helix-turn-helix domain-containing protein n=1 Tax=Caballeronia zhejiangensis TaxID=871203 RepID=UPI00158C903D|nr:winged helix-turn-helix domain-containing protein [Caballeronia zhejiangensis]